MQNTSTAVDFYKSEFAHKSDEQLARHLTHYTRVLREKVRLGQDRDVTEATVAAIQSIQEDRRAVEATRVAEEQIAVQERANDLLKLLDLMPEVYAGIETEQQRRAVAFLTRYFGVEVIEFRASTVVIRKKPVPAQDQATAQEGN